MCGCNKAITSTLRHEGSKCRGQTYTHIFSVSGVEGDRPFGHKLNGVSPCDWARYLLVLGTGNLSLFRVQKMGLRIGRADSDLVELCVTGALGKWEHGE